MKNRSLKQSLLNGPQMLRKLSYLNLSLLLVFVWLQAYAENDLQKLSYYRGYVLWKEQLSRPGIPYDFKQVLAGMQAAQIGTPLDMGSPEELETLVRKIQKAILEKELVDNLSNANRFLAQVATSDDIIELKMGELYYKQLREGTGAAITAGSSPLLTYTAHTLELDGEDDLPPVTEPTCIELLSTIKGFAEGVVGMRVGEQRRLYIHPNLAYGESGGLVGPNRLLIFDVEVVRVES
jgi:peptidylprolyl isomerase